jgi:dihydrofolate reductase
MSKLVMWNLVTLDGFFDGAKGWDLDWHHAVLGEKFFEFANEQLRAADRLIFGRATYEGMAAYWSKAKGEDADLMNRLPKVVFSRTLKRAEWANTELMAGDAATEVKKLKRSGDRYSFIFGSGRLCQSLMARDLFDEYRIFVVPVILGCGRPLFEAGLPRRKLKLLEARELSGGCLMRYQPQG